MYPGCFGADVHGGRKKSYANMEGSCSRFTAPEGGTRLASAVAEKNTLAVEYSAFVATRLLHEDAYKIRGPFSEGFQRSVYVTRASRVACVAYDLHILTDLTTVKALKYTDVEDWAKELEEKQVIVCTSQVLKFILQGDVLRIQCLNVLIIDSCHLIFEDQNLQYIMKCYKECKDLEQPRILALTYPLFTSGKYSEFARDNTLINSVEDNDTTEMTATCVQEMCNGKDAETDNKIVLYNNCSNETSDSDSESKVVIAKVVKIRELCEKEMNVSDEIQSKHTKEDAQNEIQSKHTNENNLVSKSNKSIHKTSNTSETDNSIAGNAQLIVEQEKNDLAHSTDVERDDITKFGTKNIEILENTTADIKDQSSKDSKCIKLDELQCVQENLDDFDMYEKLEWKMEQLEQALCCKMDLAEDIDGGKRLANTVAKPKEILIEYNPQAPLNTIADAYLELERYMRDAVASAMAFMDEHRYDPTEIYGDELYEEFMNIPDPTIEPKLMFNQFLYVLNQLGPYAADKAAFCLLVKLEELKIKVPYERHFLLLCLCTSVFVKIRCQAELILSKYDDWERIRLFSTPKVLRFAEILEQFQSPEQREKTTNARFNNHKSKQLNTTSIYGNVNIMSISETVIEKVQKDASNPEMENKTYSIDKNIKSNLQMQEYDTITEPNYESKSEINYIKNVESVERCEETLSSNSNSSDSVSKNDVQNCIHNNLEGIPAGKLVRCKTTDLMDELDKCDFVTLGNKIEDRVNTYEANLKDLHDIDTDIYNHKLINVVESNLTNIHSEVEKNNLNSNNSVNVVINKEIENIKDNVDLVESNIDTQHKVSNDNKNKSNINASDNLDTSKTIDIFTETEKPDLNSDDGKKSDVARANLDVENCKSTERQKSTDLPSPKLITKTAGINSNPLEFKSKPIGYRRPHRVRGRGRVHRTNAARLQLMQQNPDALCGIVFMKEPLVAKIMFMIIVDMSRCRPSLSHLCAQYCAVESDGDDCRPRGKKHEDVLKKFRMHECNLLLATAALEEGIDLPRCNLVVRWDAPPSYRSHGLCRSRARAPRSSVALMAEAPSEVVLDNLSVYKELDQIISRKCGCGIQNEPLQSDEVYADMFTPVVTAYAPKELKEVNKTNNSDKRIVNDDILYNNNEIDDIAKEEDVQSNKNVISNTHTQNDNDKITDMCIVLKADVNNDNKSMDSEICAIEEECYHKHDENVILNECVDVVTKEAMYNNVDKNLSDERDNLVELNGKLGVTDNCNENVVKSDEESNKALNYSNKNSVDICEINEITNLSFKINDKQSDNTPNDMADFNITYKFTKQSVCDCKSGLCKCKNGGKCEIKTKSKTDDESCSVDLSTAIALINRYCGKLPSDTFTRLAPQYWMEEIKLRDKHSGELRPAYICTLRLPLNCPVKYNIVGHPMPTKVLARRMVALQACRILHKSGELDNQLMPIGKENFKAAELENLGHSDSENNDSARPGTTKRRQYYYKRTAAAFTDCQPIIDSTDADIEQNCWDDVKDSYKSRFSPDAARNTLYALSSRLWCALPERYNTRGRRLHAPQHAPHAVAVLMAARDVHGLHIPAFPVYTRSGEVRVAIERAPHADVRLSPSRARLVRRFMRFVFSDVLRVRRRGMRLQTEGSTYNNYYIVPTVRVTAEDGTAYVDIDWSFLELIYKHTEDKKNSIEKHVLLQQNEEDEEEVVEKKSKREREKDGKVKKMENPLLKPGEVFVFDGEKYRDAVVTPWYRNRDQPQYFLVAEICWNLSPESAFPSTSHGSFRDYYNSKYGVTLTQPQQPLLDVDHTSARLNLLTPRYVNRKGVALPVSSERTRRAKRDRLDQKQILVPELCTVHPFAAPLWFATVALPCVLYRINALLIADEIRRSVGADVGLGAPALRGVPPPQWPPLDFGWSLAEVLSSDEKAEKCDKKKDEDDTRKGDKELSQTDDSSSLKDEEEGEDKSEEIKEKTINDILQEKEDAENGFEIGTWSNDMASSIPIEYDDFLEPLPPNLTFCTSASGGAHWSDPIDKPKITFGPTKTFSMAESDCSYMSSDFDTEDSDLNSEGTDDETDSSGFCSRNSYAAMGVRIEYKTAHEAEAVDLERKVRVSSAPQPDPQDDQRDVVVQRRLLREGRPPAEYIDKYKESVAKHKQDIQKTNVITKDSPIKEILPDITREMEKLRKRLDLKLKGKKYSLTEIAEQLKHANDDEDSVVNDAENSDNVNIKAENDNDRIIETKLNINKIDKDENNDVCNENALNSNDSNKIDNQIVTYNNECKNKSSMQVNDIDVEIIDDVTIVRTTKVNKEVINNRSVTETVLVNNIEEINTDNFNSCEEFPEKTMASKNTSNHDSNEAENSINKTGTNQSIGNLKIKELFDTVFPYDGTLELNNGHVTLENIEKNKRILLNEFKKTLSLDEVKKMNCFSMLDIDIDSPDYVNEKVVNVGFDTMENYVDKINGFRNPKEYTPYYQDGKAQNGNGFDFDYQPDLEGHPGPSPSVILQALTMSNANDGINLERLETIGDSFLKFAITAYLYCAHPAVHEGKLSHMRSKQVSNLNLYRLGRNKRLGARMIASKFEPHDNWLPPCHKPPPTHHPASGDQEVQMQKEAATDNTGCFIPYNLITQHSIPDKSIADCVEALIGAYLLEMGPRGALLFMSWLGISVLPRHAVPLPPDHPYVVASGAGQQKPTSAPSPKQSYSSSSLSCSSNSEEQSSDDEECPEEIEESWECEWSWLGRPVGSLRPRLDDDGRWVQTVYGELRAPPSPLLRHVEDPEGELERMLSGYDALENTLQYRFRDRSLLLQALTHASHQQNRLTDCYQRLEFLGDAILDYLITRHLYEDARRHSPGALTDLRSALVNNTIFATLAARHGFHKYFRHMSPGLNEVLTKYVKIQEENGHSISEEHYLIQEDEMEQAEDVEVPKALGDLFESVAGAIFLDSGMSLGAVWSSYVRLMGAELEAFSAAAPKSPVRELLEAEPDTAKFGKPERLADGRRVRVCVEVFGRGAFKGIGRNYRIAKGTAARCALRHLRGTRPARR